MDPQQQQQMAGLMAGFGAAFLVFWLLALAFLVFVFWRIFTKAGMAGALGLIAIVPGFGFLICLCILAFGQWRVHAVPPGYALDAQPYPSQTYPPSGPPAQL